MSSVRDSRALPIWETTVKQWIIMASALAIAASVYLLYQSSHEEPSASSAATAGIAARAPAPPPLVHRARPPALASASVDDNPRAAPAASEPSANPRAAVDAAPTADEIRDQIAASFASDLPVPPSQDRKPELQARLRETIPAGSSVRSIECRSALCRVETVHPSFEAFESYVQAAYAATSGQRITNGPILASLLSPPVDGQPVVAVAFLGRKGAPLPIFDAPPSARSP